MPVGPIKLGHDQIKDENVTHDGRNIRRLRYPHDEGFNPRKRLVIDEDGMGRFEPNASVVTHVNGDARDGQVFLG